MFAELHAALRQADEDYLIGLSNKGTVKRAKKDLEGLTPAAQEEKLLENPVLFQTPIVRNGKEATVGYHPEVWETWA